MSVAGFAANPLDPESLNFPEHPEMSAKSKAMLMIVIVLMDKEPPKTKNQVRVSAQFSLECVFRIV